MTNMQICTFSQLPADWREVQPAQLCGLIIRQICRLNFGTIVPKSRGAA